MNLKRLSDHDRNIIRRLALRKFELASTPDNLERKNAWYALDEGSSGMRPMVLAEIWDAAADTLPPSSFECTGPDARFFENILRGELYQYEVLKDDHVIAPFFDVGWQVRVSDYGVHAEEHSTDNQGMRSAKKWIPPLQNLQEDFTRLRPRTFSVDRKATLDYLAYVKELFDGVLDVRIRGGYWWTMGLTQTAINLVGLDNLMLYMCMDPDGLHRFMAFLRDEALRQIDWLEKEQLFTLNNEHDYIGSGSIGYTRSLPRPGKKPNEPITGRDLWVLSESQETVGVGPEQFGEFVLPYQAAVTNRFGKCYYGCCEPLHLRMPLLKKHMPNLARVSVSPWADQELMARECGKDYVFSRKPHPTLVSTKEFDEAAIRADLEKTLTIARGCKLELVLKDIHTLDGKPERLARWVALARQAIDRLWR